MTDVIDDFLVHYGVKGMKWGVRNDGLVAGNRLVAGPTIDPTLHTSTQNAAKKVAGLVGERYGYQVTEIKALTTSHHEYSNGTVGYVENTPGKSGGVVYVRQEDLRKQLKDAENSQWFAKGTGTPEAFLTHEAGHSIFHAEQAVKRGLLSNKVVGGHMEARDKALQAAMMQAEKDGVPDHLTISKISGYALAAGSREEVEAEMFSQYHWGTSPPRFVQVWGQTLHNEMGIDPTPFRQGR